MSTKHGARVAECRTPQEAIEGADIIVTCGPITSSPDRVGDLGWVKRGALVVTLDYDCYWKPEALAAADAIFTDDIPQLEHQREYGYFGGVRAIAGEVGDVLAGKVRGRVSGADKIFSIYMGIALEDVSVARRIYLAARAQGRGTSLPR